MRRSLWCLLLGFACAGTGCAPTNPVDNGGGGGSESLIYTNTNVAGVSNDPTVATTFTLTKTHTITRIRTYHWNGGSGSAAAGTVSLQSSTNATFGPWSCTGSGGTSDVDNLYWDCYPNTELEPGTYTIVDSDEGTWAHNAESGHAGIVWVYGTAEGSDDATEKTALEALHECTYMSVFVHGRHFDTAGRELVYDHQGMSTWMWEPGGFEIVRATVVWDGTSFSAVGGNEAGSATLNISGEVSADGRSIFNVRAVFLVTGESGTTREINTNSLPVPLVTDRQGYWPNDPSGNAHNELWLQFEVTGAAVENHIASIVNTRDEYASTSYEGTDPVADLEIFFREYREED